MVIDTLIPFPSGENLLRQLLLSEGIQVQSLNVLVNLRWPAEEGENSSESRTTFAFGFLRGLMSLIKGQKARTGVMLDPSIPGVYAVKLAFFPSPEHEKQILNLLAEKGEE